MPSKRRRARRDRENSGGPSPAWIGSAVLLGLVAVALVIVLIHAAVSRKPGTATAATPPSAPSGSTAQAGGAASPGGSPPATAAGADQAGRPAGCSTTGADQTTPTSPPTGVTWSLTAGFAVPPQPGTGRSCTALEGLVTATPTPPSVPCWQLPTSDAAPAPRKTSRTQCSVCPSCRMSTPPRSQRRRQRRTIRAAQGSSWQGSGSFPTPRIRPALRWPRVWLAVPIAIRS